MPRPLCALTCLTLACGQAFAQHAPGEPAETSRPAASGRVVGRFDFEERTTNPYAVPRNWSRHQDEPGATPDAPRLSRDGFPTWNQAYLDYSFACEGEGSFCLPTSGGSTAARVDAGALPVFPDADYLVSVRVRTNELRHARARLSAWVLDRSGKIVESSVMRGELIIAETGWVTTTISLPGQWPDAAFLQVELELLQPERFAPGTLGPHQVWAQDIRGAAWFDDLTVAQLPRVSIATGGIANITVAPEPPRVRTLVRDMTGERITSRVRVYDDLGTLIDTIEEAAQAGAGWRDWQPRLSRYGWYRATLEVLQGPRRVGSTYVDFVWVPPAERGGRLGLVLPEMPDAVRDVLPELARAAGAAGVTIPVWSESLEPAAIPAKIDGLGPSVTRLLQDGRRITFSLPQAPAGLAARVRVDPDDPLTVLSTPESEWEPMLLPFLDKFGQSVQRWQVGRHRAQPRWLREDAAGSIARLQDQIGRVVPGPRLVLPWPVELAPPPNLLGESAPGLIALTVAPTSRPEGMADIAASWVAAAGPDSPLPPIAAAFLTLPEEEYSRRDVAADLLRRVVEFGAGFDPVMPGGAPELGLIAPWTVGGGAGRTAQVIPGVGLAVWANLSQRLRGRHVAGLFPVAPGVRCFILAPDAGASSQTTGALVAWREEPSAAAAIHAYLGDGRVTAIDLYGNERAVPQVDDDGAALAATAPHHLPITDDPVFLEGVDVEFAQLAASFRLEPGFAPCTQEEHEHRIVLTNPWGTAIDGKLVIVEPGGYSTASGQRDRGWRITPRVTRFTAGPRETVTLPVTIAFSPVEEAGMRDFIAEVELEGGRGRLRMRAPLEIGLDSIRLDLSYRFGPDPAGPDLIVEAIVGNNGKVPVTFEVGAFAPAEAGYPRNRASVSALKPGDTAVRRFGFPGGAASLRGKRVTVGVTDIESGARINRSIAVE